MMVTSETVSCFHMPVASQRSSFDGVGVTTYAKGDLGSLTGALHDQQGSTLPHGTMSMGVAGSYMA